MNPPRCILVVDDQECDRMLANRVLQKVWPGITIIEACDGVEAIKLLGQPDCENPDIILLDINMPKMNGREFLHSWYDDSEIDVPVVLMLTSSDLLEDRESVKRFRCVRNYIVKPLTKHTAARLPELAA